MGDGGGQSACRPSPDAQAHRSGNAKDKRPEPRRPPRSAPVLEAALNRAGRFLGNREESELCTDRMDSFRTSQYRSGGPRGVPCLPAAGRSKSTRQGFPDLAPRPTGLTSADVASVSVERSQVLVLRSGRAR